MTVYLLPLAAALLAPSGQAKPTPDKEETQTVVITAQAGEARRAYEDCRARQCPPLEDMATSLRYAETLFVAGEYQDARGILRGATGRNGKHASEHPREVGALYRAASRIAAHLGEGQEYERRAFGMVRALKAGLPAESPEVMLAQIEVARTQTSLNDYRGAMALLEEVHGVAERSGQRALQGVAAVRLAALKHLTGGRAEARRLLAPILAWDDPALAQVRLAARILIARFDRVEGKPDNVDSLIATLRTQPGSAPVLVKQDPVQIDWYDPRGARAGVGETATVRAEHWNEPDVHRRWADIGFWVRADGRVEDVEVLRASRAEPQWVDPVLAQFKSRIYTPAAVPAAQGVYRVERVTVTALWDKVTGTHRRVRAPRFRVENLDLTVEQPKG